MRRSVVKSNLTTRAPMMVIMDLSLKPALTSLTTEAFVRRALLSPDCAHAEAQINRQRTRRRQRKNKKTFITIPLLLATTRRLNNGCRCTRLSLNRVVAVAAADAFDVVARLFERRHPVTVIEDPTFARIITRQGQINLPVEHHQELLQILCATANIVRR